jgi:hypothetical protein
MGLVPDEVLRQNAVGVKIDITIIEDGVPVNLVGVTKKDYFIQKPSGLDVTKNTVFVTTGIDGKLRYITIVGDLDEIGQYLIQADLEFPGGYDGTTNIGTFWVEANLQP